MNRESLHDILLATKPNSNELLGYLLVFISWQPT